MGPSVHPPQVGVFFEIYLFITARNEVGARLCFYRGVSTSPDPPGPGRPHQTRYTPWDHVHPPWDEVHPPPGTPPWDQGDTVSAWAVHILL